MCVPKNVTFVKHHPKMSVHPIQTISIIGAGNVAERLGYALKRKGIVIREVCNRTEEKGKKLARKLGASFVAHPESLDDGVDMILIAVADHAIAALASSIHTRGLVVHTSGCTDMHVLDGVSPGTGVFYPLQTLRKERPVAISRVPFCVEASNSEDETRLMNLAKTLSGNVVVMDSARRRYLHLAAVFAANFPNFMYAIAEDLLHEQGIPADILRPVISQTAGNARHLDFFSLQTGPAVRNDQEVMEMHRAMLGNHPVYRKIYDLLSESITQQKRNNDKL